MRTQLILCLGIFLVSCTNKVSNTLVLNTEDFKNFQLDSLGKNNESLLLFKDKVIDFGTIMEKQTSEILIYFPYANIGQSRLRQMFHAIASQL